MFVKQLCFPYIYTMYTVVLPYGTCINKKFYGIWFLEYLTWCTLQPLCNASMDEVYATHYIELQIRRACDLQNTVFYHWKADGRFQSIKEPPGPRLSCDGIG